MKFQYILPAFLATAYAACPDAGSTNDKGYYSCNPAHQYPNQQTCKDIDGCPVLCDKDGKPIDNKPQPSASTTAAAACPSAGSTNNKGYYSCNPAHQYPNEQKCITVDGCPVLCDKDGKPIDNKPNSTASTTPTPSATGKVCPAPGTTDAQGRYSCNPAHEYPSGQVCKIVDGCPFLADKSGNVVCNTSVVPVPLPSPTGKVCPAAGSTDSQGRYSCNPAHQYPTGQTCKVVDGCPVLVSDKPQPTHQPSQVPVGAGSVAGAAPFLALAAIGLAL